MQRQTDGHGLKFSSTADAVVKITKIKAEKHDFSSAVMLLGKKCVYKIHKAEAP